MGELGPDLISLVTTREEINDLLVLDDVIDLVIPRCAGSEGPWGRAFGQRGLCVARGSGGPGARWPLGAGAAMRW